MCLLYGILSYLLEDMQTIEKIQRRAIKLIYIYIQDIGKKFEFEKGSRDRNKK